MGRFRCKEIQKFIDQKLSEKFKKIEDSEIEVVFNKEIFQSLYKLQNYSILFLKNKQAIKIIVLGL